MAIKKKASIHDEFRLGDLILKNRIIMAPLTRTRADNPGHVPTDLMREYYEQRASAGLIISEGAWVSENGQGWHGAPGIYNQEQRDAWKSITTAVHAKGGLIFAQLWHQGSTSLPRFFKSGRGPFAPSAINPNQLVHAADGTHMSEIPLEMTLEEIRQTVADYRNAALMAKEAGFDGIQIQAGFVYLIQQFLHEPTNKRTDAYGGSIENRARFLFEVLEATLEIWPSQRVGIKTGPMMNELGLFMATSSTLPIVEYVYNKLNDYKLSHLLIMRPMADLSATPIAALIGDNVIEHARRHYHGNLMLNVGLSPESAIEIIEKGEIDLVAFGRAFIANPDLVERIKSGSILNEIRQEGIYGSSPFGFTDYPLLADK
jgi:N-ethylmaleimide reductase